MKTILAVVLMALSLNVLAAERTAVSRIDKNVTFTITDKECIAFPSLPEGAPLKEARAYDAAKNESIYGCALDYGTKIEFQLISSDQKKHWQFFIPTNDFIAVDPI
jgi:hypothetical protein